MSLVDVDFLLQEVDPVEPCGPNLEYDPAFLELEQAVLGKPEVQYGGTITPAVPPEWKQVRRLAIDLLARTRDLRIAVPLSRALLALEGPAGLADGLKLVERLLDERWDSVHPQLDPDDDLDPTLRVNSIATLADAATTIRELKDAPLLVLPALGPLTVRTIEIAYGEVAPLEAHDKLALSTIEAALADVAPDQLQGAARALARAHDSLAAIERVLVQRVGASHAISLDALGRVLRRARDFLPAVPPPSDAQAAQEQVDGMASSTVAGAANAPAISGEIASREDVLHMLDRICRYYQRYEPSSPVPLLLERAKRLVPKNFIELLEDLAPSGIEQLAAIRGRQTDA
ncbi:type VI secretion system protein TssA [Massilia horti]|uniref:Type VI secretion system protein TssA n=1 Tax=Massilia horti TaxID=2562153 RepID=A0A4Y9SYQ0_9BURK|nr:type VI secretion system protein TssA [Massilia horti]TFW31972.1 type VI secretion system protein TssA [Massilia horti]